jgi:hypothetical protein
MKRNSQTNDGGVLEQDIEHEGAIAVEIPSVMINDYSELDDEQAEIVNRVQNTEYCIIALVDYSSPTGFGIDFEEFTKNEYVVQRFLKHLYDEFPLIVEKISEKQYRDDIGAGWSENITIRNQTGRVELNLYFQFVGDYS